MSSFRRTIHRIIPILFAEAKRIAEKEAPEGLEIFREIDFTADWKYDSNQALKVVSVDLLHRGFVIWEKDFPITEADVWSMENDKFEQKTSLAMRGSLTLVGQMHFARLAQLFPRRIKDVTVGYDVDKGIKTIRVQFNNGHVAEASEGEARTDLFTARCAMLYDLPPL